MAFLLYAFECVLFDVLDGGRLGRTGGICKGEEDPAYRRCCWPEGLSQ